MQKTLPVLILTALCSCTSLPSPTPKQPPTPKKPPEELALQFYELFRRDGKTEDLVIADNLAKMAYQRAPDDVNLQEILYKTQYVRAALTPNYDLSQLETLYGSLNPILASNLAPPSKIEYSQAVKDQRSSAEKIHLLHKIIQDQPYFSDSWYNLAKLYSDQNQTWQALYPALKAVQLNPEIADYQFLAGYIIESLAFEQDCWADHKDYLPKALPYLVKAVSLEEHEVFYDNLALLYMRLGLAPIAYQQASKAWQIKTNGWNGTHLAQAAFLMGKKTEAQQIAKLVVTEHKQIEGYFLLALLAIEERNWQSARQLLHNFHLHLKTLEPGTETTEVFIPYFISWLDDLIQFPAKPGALPQISAPSPWTHWLVTSVEANLTKDTKTTLAELASNSCQRTQAQLLDAMMAWREGKQIQTHRWLTELAQRGTPLYDQSLLAKAMLRSGFFSPDPK